MAGTMKPFADDESTMQVGGLTVENGTERISFSGSLDLARDHQALEHAKALRAVLDAVVSALESDHTLPAKAPEPKVAKASTAKNPFA